MLPMTDNDGFNTQAAIASIRARARIIFCAIAFALSVGLGISIGFTQRTPEFNPIAPLALVNTSRIVTVPFSVLTSPLISPRFPRSPSRLIWSPLTLTPEP
jgi:hypothetical protein